MSLSATRLLKEWRDIQKSFPAAASVMMSAAEFPFGVPLPESVMIQHPSRDITLFPRCPPLQSSSHAASSASTPPQPSYHWTALLSGPKDTPFEGARWEVAIKPSADYPHSPPSVVFITPIFHPNIDFVTGEICLDILKSAWSPSWSIEAVCRALLLLLSSPEPSSPLNVDAGNMLRAGDIRAYWAMAKMHVLDHAALLPLPEEEGLGEGNVKREEARASKEDPSDAAERAGVKASIGEEEEEDDGVTASAVPTSVGEIQAATAPAPMAQPTAAVTAAPMAQAALITTQPTAAEVAAADADVQVETSAAPTQAASPHDGASSETKVASEGTGAATEAASDSCADGSAEQAVYQGPSKEHAGTSELAAATDASGTESAAAASFKPADASTPTAASASSDVETDITACRATMGNDNACNMPEPVGAGLESAAATESERGPESEPEAEADASADLDTEAARESDVKPEAGAIPEEGADNSDDELVQQPTTTTSPVPEIPVAAAEKDDNRDEDDAASSGDADGDGGSNCEDESALDVTADSIAEFMGKARVVPLATSFRAHSHAHGHGGVHEHVQAGGHGEGTTHLNDSSSHSLEGSF